MDAIYRQDRMRTERGRRKIQAVINSVEADLDDPESRHHDLNPKNRALFLMKVKREMTEDAVKAGVLLSEADLKPFDKKINEYLKEVKKIKENAAEKAKKAKEKRERKAARKQLKKETDAVTKIATVERGRQARTLKKRMEQKNKLSDLMDKNMDIPADKDLPYFDESGQLTERQKKLADKMAAQKITTKGGKRKTRKRKRKTKRKKKRKTKRRRRGGMNGSTGGTDSTPLPRPSTSPGSTGSRDLDDEERRRLDEAQRRIQEERIAERRRILQVQARENARVMQIIARQREDRLRALRNEGSSGRGLGGGKRRKRRKTKKKSRRKLKKKH
tara:strand:- start:23 stop:1015 length:993 start_codon:yes stop_codon:yes gene_type:complete